MRISTVLAKTALAAAIVLLNHASFAFDLNGAWGSDASACGKIFQKTGDKISIKVDADMYGGGFIISNDSIAGTNVACKIKARKMDGPVGHIVAMCAAENVAMSTFQFSYRVKDDNNIVRIYPGVEELNTDYTRCTL